MLESLSPGEKILDRHVEVIERPHGRKITDWSVQKRKIIGWTVPKKKIIDRHVSGYKEETINNINIDEDEDEQYLNNIILKFCTNKIINTKKLQGKLGTCLHVLDLYRKSLLINENESDHHEVIMMSRSSAPEGNNSTTSKSSGSSGMGTGDPNIVRSAVNLQEAGIKFMISESRSLKDISFQGQVLRLPSVVIDDTTESTFLNLMALERFHVGAGNEITSYVCFMDNIIDSAEDVKILRHSGVVHNGIGSDEAVAKLFNEMTKDATPDSDSQLEELERKLNEYCKNKWHRWRANLIHTYFRSPWALLSLLAAVLLLLLTIFQTLYTIYPYYNPARARN